MTMTVYLKYHVTTNLVKIAILLPLTDGSLIIVNTKIKKIKKIKRKAKITIKIRFYIVDLCKCRISFPFHKGARLIANKNAQQAKLPGRHPGNQPTLSSSQIECVQQDKHNH